MIFYFQITNNYFLPSFPHLLNDYPFFPNQSKQMMLKIVDCKYDFNGTIWKYASPESRQFIKKLLIYKPENRLSASQALNHAWQLKQFNLSERTIDDDSMKKITNHLRSYAAISDLQKMSRMVIAHQTSTEEIVELRKAFDQYDTSNEGTITLEEFKKGLQSTSLDESQMEEIFAKIDVSNTHQIEYKEFLAATIETRGRIEEERLAEAFDRIDSDDSGYITRQVRYKYC